MFAPRPQDQVGNETSTTRSVLYSFMKLIFETSMGCDESTRCNIGLAIFVSRRTLCKLLLLLPDGKVGLQRFDNYLVIPSNWVWLGFEHQPHCLCTRRVQFYKPVFSVNNRGH